MPYLVALASWLSAHRGGQWTSNLTLGVVLGGFIHVNTQLIGVLAVMVVIDALASAAHRAFGTTYDPRWGRSIGVKFVLYLLFIPTVVLLGSSSLSVFDLADDVLLGVALVTEVTSILLHLAEIHERGKVFLEAFRKLFGRSVTEDPEQLLEALKRLETSGHVTLGKGASQAAPEGETP